MYGIGGDSMTVSFAERAGGSGVEIRDPLEHRTCSLHTPTPVRPTPVSTDSFYFPVDDAVSLATGRLTLPITAATYVRNDRGEMMANVTAGTDRTFAGGRRYVELCTPIKLYLQVDGGFRVSATFDGVRFEFEEGTVLVGGRSPHRQPKETVTTTSDPTDVMAAVSTFGSALKTTSPERSFPTLRGHPPAIELGDELRVPDDLARPGTGVRIELPAERRFAYASASLAYYLGAEVVPGSVPKLVADGFEHPLRTARGFEGEVERVLKQTFLFDCLARTAGFYPIDLHERERIEPLVDLDFDALYDAPLPERLSTYLSVPYAAVEDHVPAWQATTHVSPSPENVEVLPYLVDDLAVVRTPRVRRTSRSTLDVPAVDEFVRGDSTRSTTDATGTVRSLVVPEANDSLEQVWVGDDPPLGGSTATATAFRNRLRQGRNDGEIAVTVVCNDREMNEELDIAGEVYGSRDELPFDVTVRHELTVAQLRSVLESEVQFLHYIGHIDDGGFECADGMLDASTLDSVGVEAFLLNACRSYEQGMALIDAGSVGGVVTLNDVINSGAVRVGKAMVRLLNRGFPLRAALDIARDRSIIGDQYVVVGDGSMDIVQTESPTAILLEIEPTGADAFDMTIHSYVSGTDRLGGFVTPSIGADPRCYLASGELDTFSVSRDELFDIFALETVPFLYDGELTWSDDVNASEL